ncbi:MAG: hypothetical protein NC204_06290 [Candidatus Amulumruptor caecigallinarius]|nr:hypothetical protein [Candidatus Amulumruptor caecigallinarius]
MAIIIPMFANAMKIATDELDEFTGQRTVITSWESLCTKSIHIRFRLQNDVTWLDFKFMNDAAIVIPEGGKLLFKATNDSITTFVTHTMYHGGVGDGAVNLIGSKAWGISASYTGDIEWFSANITRLLRVYATDGYYDKKVGESDGKKLCKLYTLFSQTINNKPGTITFMDYTIQFCKRGAKSSSWDIVKEEFYQDLSKEELQIIIDDWKKQTTDKYIYDCKIKKSK